MFSLANAILTNVILAKVILASVIFANVILANVIFASVLLGQYYLAGTTSQPAAKEWSRTSASAGSMHVSNCAQIPIFHNRDGSTFTPTSVTSPPCGGRPLNIDSCSCPNGNTITANNFIAAAVPLIQDILSG